MKTRTLWILVVGVAVILVGVGMVGALPARTEPSGVAGAAPAQLPATVTIEGDRPLAPEAVVNDAISYQGRLTDPGGTPLDGSYTMRFRLYTASSGGTLLWDSGAQVVAVSGGLFKVDLGVDPGDFNGQALWMQLTVSGQTLSPRQEILPAPYALSLRPGADISGEPPAWSEGVLDVEMTGSWPAGRSIAGLAPSTGTAIYADANGGTGLYAHSEGAYGVWGSSTASWGGYFTSDSGYGIRVDTSGTSHYDHGAYITSQGGYGVYAQSAENMAVRGEAGDVSGMVQPMGPVGVAGIGVSKGVFGSSKSGYGVYAYSDSSYGVWAQSNTYRGVTGRTYRADDNYGVFTTDNLYSKNYHLAGAIMQVVQNGGDAALEPGDVVVFSGMGAPVAAGEGPVPQVAATMDANSTAVAGVVYSRFNTAAVDPATDYPDARGANADIEVTPEGPVAPGDYLLLVVQGPAQVKAGALAGAVVPGDLLATGGEAGVAVKAADVAINGVTMAAPGTVFGKALEPLKDGQALIYVYVTLQ